MLLLLAVVVWSFYGISIAIGYDLEEAGGWLMAGYAWILGFPLAVVIPLATYRSLAREFEDETIQLVSITTMSARRIVLGKLGSALLQVVVYLAAIVPCIAFSYVLRGIDFEQIALVLAVAVTGAICLTCLSLMLAGFSRNVFLRVGMNLFLVVALLIFYLFWCGFNVAISQVGSQGEIVIAAGGFCAFFLTTSYLCFESCTSLISFQAENRSSRIRLAVSLQVMIILAAITGSTAAFSSIIGSAPDVGEFLPWIALYATHYFCLVGAMMASERPGLSKRVQRELPQSFAGRIIQGLYLPGPGRGYLFALSGILLWNFVFMIFTVNANPINSFFRMPLGPSWDEGAICGFLINIMFGCAYLSLTYLVMLFLGRFAGSARILVGLLWTVILYVLVATLTVSIQEIFRGSYSDFSFALYFNWVLAFDKTRISGSTFGSFFENVALLLLPTAALTVASVLHAIRELVTPGTAIPARVQEELQKQKKKVVPKGETFEEIFQQRKSEQEAGG